MPTEPITDHCPKCGGDVAKEFARRAPGVLFNCGTCKVGLIVTRGTFFDWSEDAGRFVPRHAYTVDFA